MDVKVENGGVRVRRKDSGVKSNPKPDKDKRSKRVLIQAGPQKSGRTGDTLLGNDMTVPQWKALMDANVVTSPWLNYLSKMDKTRPVAKLSRHRIILSGGGEMSKKGEGKVARWYFGGLSSAGAACFTHPLDLLKVQLQTQQEKKLGVGTLTANIIRKDGLFSLYNGISASLLRQLTYSTARFGIYEALNQSHKGDGPVPFSKKVLIAGVAGAAGGVVGSPADLVNVRMQNDIKLPTDQRRNYKNAIDGLYRVLTEEGARRCFSGASMATSRAVFMTIGQLAFYDFFKAFLLKFDAFGDTPVTHFLASLGAGGVATVMTQPLDVMKTRAMNAKPGEFKNLAALFVYTAKLGPQGFFKGFVPAFVRLAPQTILTFLFMEQLRANFGEERRLQTL